MKDYLALWEDFIMGILSLIVALLLPIIWLVLLFRYILPYGVICLFTGLRLKKGYRYLYFLPYFVKIVTRPLRNREESKDE